MAENTNLVEAFMSKFSERNAMSIAADMNYDNSEAGNKIVRKFGQKIDFQHSGWEGIAIIDGEKFRIYNANGAFYGINGEGKCWNLRKVEKEVPKRGEHSTDRMTTKPIAEYQIITPLTDPEMIDFLKAMAYVSSADRFEAVKQAKADKKAVSDKNTEQARKIIKVEVVDGKYTDPNWYVDEVEDDDWGREDDEAEFNIKITVGSTPIFEGLALAGVNWCGTGDHRTSWGIIKISLDSVDLAFLEDAEGNQYEVYDLADRVPEGKFRDMFVKYGEQFIEDAIGDYIISRSGKIRYEW